MKRKNKRQHQFEKAKTLRQHGKFMIGTNLLVFSVFNMHGCVWNVREKVCGFGCKVKATPVFIWGKWPRDRFVFLTAHSFSLFLIRIPLKLGLHSYTIVCLLASLLTKQCHHNNSLMMQYTLAYLIDIYILVQSIVMTSAVHIAMFQLRQAAAYSR